MITPIILFCVGLILLIKGGDWFVDGATGIATYFHVPDLLIGATVVSIGTTLPEVMVSVSSAISGHGELAYGNALGSIICNASLILAVTLISSPGTVDKNSLKRPVTFFFIAAVYYIFKSYTTGSFSRIDGILLLCLFVIYIILSVRDAIAVPASASSETIGSDVTEHNTDANSTVLKNLVFLVIGAILIAIGADLLVDNGTLIAQMLGVPESVIALTFVALGTSLPELITAITSMMKGHGALSLGNVIGANLFNLVLVSGASIAVAPFSIPANKTIAGINSSLVLDIPVMIIVMLLVCVPAMTKGKLGRGLGILLLCIYAAFCICQFFL